MANTSKQKTRTGRRLWLLPVAAGLFLLGVLGWFTFRYQSRFTPRTEILGVDCANMTAEEAARTLQAAADRVEFVLTDETGEEIVRLPLNAFLEKDQLSELAGDAFARQKQEAGLFDWLLAPGGKEAPAILSGVSDRQIWTLLEETLYGAEPRVAPVDARVELSDDGYLVVEEEPGNLVDLKVCGDALGSAFKDFRSLTEPVGTLEAKNARIRPVVTAGGESVRHVVEQLEAYTHLRISLTFADDSAYELTPEDIWSVSDVEIVGRDVVAGPDEERVRELTDTLATDYGFDGVYAKFHNAEKTREYIYYRVGDTGWKMDKEALAADTADALREQVDAEIVPQYDYTWYWKDYYKYYNVQDTFIEISLDNQYLWAYVDGELLVETPVVTGSILRGDNTRRGCFRIAYKDADLNLRGPTWDDHVDFWMPFDDQIGLHDSFWRDDYGADIYLEDGSHGCINTPHEAMEIIFNAYDRGDVVIVY